MIAALVATIALGSQRVGTKLKDFSLTGTDAKTYNLKRLNDGKPALVVYMRVNYDFPPGLEQARDDQLILNGFESPNGVRDLNRLASATRGKLRIFGMVGSSAKEALKLIKQTGVQFTLLSGPKYQGCGAMTDQMLLGYNSRDLAHLQNALIWPDGRLGAVWQGYSRASFTQLQRMVAQKTGVRLKLPLSRFPAKKQFGRIEMFGLPGP